MTRYQLVYTKSDTPLTRWVSAKDEALTEAERLRGLRYSVDIWEHNENGGRPIELENPVLNEAIKSKKENTL